MPVHTPYDGSSKPFAVGLKPLDPSTWIEVDGQLGDYLDEKDRLFAEAPDAVFRANPETAEAEAECRDLIVGHLLDQHAATYRRSGNTIEIPSLKRAINLDEGAPLWAAARLVQEDLCLMRRAPEGWVLAAAALCFPSSWSLAEKIGRPMADIHAPVPHFAGRMEQIVSRIFDKLQADCPVVRFNWSLYDDAVLHHPEPHEGRKWAFGKEIHPGDVYIRVERQTLTRLPVSGDIVFTIRIHIDTLDEIAKGPDGAVHCAGLRAQILGLDDAALNYKSMGMDKDRLTHLLQRLSERVS